VGKALKNCVQICKIKLTRYVVFLDFFQALQQIRKCFAYGFITGVSLKNCSSSSSSSCCHIVISWLLKIHILHDYSRSSAQYSRKPLQCITPTCRVGLINTIMWNTWSEIAGVSFGPSIKYVTLERWGVQEGVTVCDMGGGSRACNATLFIFCHTCTIRNLKLKVMFNFLWGGCVLTEYVTSIIVIIMLHLN